MSKPTVRVTAIQTLSASARNLYKIPEDVLDDLYAHFRTFVTREMRIGSHVDRVSVDGYALRVNYHIDTDGALWIEVMGV